MSGISDRIWQHCVDAAVSYGLTALLLLVVIWASMKMRSWYREDSGPAADPEDLLLHFRDLHRRGHLSEAEFRSIKGQLVDPPVTSSAQSAESAPANKTSGGQNVGPSGH